MNLTSFSTQVGVVNFTWRAGDRKYLYHFDRLLSFNEDILLPPVVSVDTRGRIPRKPKGNQLLHSYENTFRIWNPENTDFNAEIDAGVVFCEL